MKIVDTKLTVANKLNEYQKIIKTIPAIMGDANDVVAVSGQSGFVYVRDMTGNTLVVWNSIAPLIAGLAVMVGNIGGRLQVVEVRDVYYSSTVASVAPHGSMHSYGIYGIDVVNIYPEQFMPWYAFTSDSDPFTVSIIRQVMSASGVWVTDSVEDIDLNAHIPVGGTNAVYVLITLDEDGVLQHTVGSTIASKAALVITDIPAIPDLNVPLWAVILYVGQTEITRASSDSDYVDLRFSQTGSGGNSLYVPEGETLQIGAVDAFPTTSRIAFGDAGSGTDYVYLYEKFDDMFAIHVSVTGDVLQAGWTDGFVDFVARFGDIDNTEHGNYLDIDSNGFHLRGSGSLNVVSFEDEAVFMNDEMVCY